MKILLGCEESQEVCKAFRAKGLEAYSCDLLDCSGGFPEWHFKNDILEVIRGGLLQLQNGDFVIIDKWALGIFFPECTHLAVSGAKHFAVKRADGRQRKAIDFFMNLVNCGIEKTSLENPIGIMSTEYRKPDQIIQPYMFGDPFTKTTCLWLKGLPKLTATDIVDKGTRDITKSGKSLPSWYNLPPGPDRAKIRSKTFPGIAKAMADQWADIL